MGHRGRPETPAKARCRIQRIHLHAPLGSSHIHCDALRPVGARLGPPREAPEPVPTSTSPEGYFCPTESTPSSGCFRQHPEFKSLSQDVPKEMPRRRGGALRKGTNHPRIGRKGRTSCARWSTIPECGPDQNGASLPYLPQKQPSQSEGLFTVSLRHRSLRPAPVGVSNSPDTATAPSWGVRARATSPIGSSGCP
jgi:hypothetical protein